jgi:uncharacterized protein (TIGR00255 family)
MLLSMTGYGKANVVLNNQSYTMHIKSLNSKTLDLFVKLPLFLKDKEIDIRAMLGKMLERGKIDFSMTSDQLGGETNVSVNKDKVRFYKKEVEDLASELQISLPEDFVSLLLKMPDVVQTNNGAVDESQWKLVSNSLNSAIEELIVWRTSEGKALEKDIASRINRISKTLYQVVKLEKKRKGRIREKLLGDLQSVASEISIDQNRLEQELIYYLDRIDISEEIIRAQKHCSFFLTLLKENVSNGKKLTFASQEILRELNTMGVKANDADIQMLTVEMKDEIEKVREQLANIL